MASAIINISHDGLTVALSEEPSAAIADSLAPIITAQAGLNYVIVSDRSNIIATLTTVTAAIQLEGWTVTTQGEVPIDWVSMKREVLGCASFINWASATVNAYPGLAIAFIAMNAAIDAGNVDATKAAYWQIIVIAPPPTSAASEWQGILDNLGITALKFA